MKWLYAAALSWSWVGQVDEIASLICCAVMLSVAPATNKGCRSCGWRPSRSHNSKTCRPRRKAFRLTSRRIITSSSISYCSRACLLLIFIGSMRLQLEWFSKVLNAGSSESWSSSLSDVAKLNYACKWQTDLNKLLHWYNIHFINKCNKSNRNVLATQVHMMIYRQMHAHHVPTFSMSVISLWVAKLSGMSSAAG